MPAAARITRPGLGLGALLLVALAGCEPVEETPRDQLPFSPTYLGIRTTLLDGDLVQFHVDMRGARDAVDVDDYAECAAAQYAVIRGFGFARHLRTNVSNEAGLWTGDAVYTISDALPRGLKTIDAEVTVANCAENGIPMV